MAVKKDTKAWAIKVRGRSLLLNRYGYPQLFPTKAEAKEVAVNKAQFWDITAEAVRVKVRIEEIE